VVTSWLAVLDTDLTGSKDGTVRLWEWGHMDCINEPRKPGAFPKVTKVLFNAQGNKVHTMTFYFQLQTGSVLASAYQAVAHC